MRWDKSWKTGISVLTNVTESWLQMSTNWSWETRRVCFQRTAGLWHTLKFAMACQIHKLGRVTEIHCEILIFNWKFNQRSVTHQPLCWGAFVTKSPTQPHWTAQLLLWSRYSYCYYLDESPDSFLRGPQIQCHLSPGLHYSSRVNHSLHILQLTTRSSIDHW